MEKLGKKGISMKQTCRHRAVYFYVLEKTGKINVYKGCIYQSDFDRLVYPKRVVFKESPKKKNGFKRYASNKPGIFWNNSIWFKERNDIEAIYIFEEHLYRIADKKEKELKLIQKRIDNMSIDNIEYLFEEN